jgi:DNA-binding transcriptional LysR family regulator
VEFRHLRYFVAIVQEGQFVRAAAELHVAQSALSQQIRDLERELGTELLYRDRRGVTPTPAGEVLLGHARTLLAGEERARAEIAQLTGLITGRLQVGFGSPSGPVPIPATLTAFRRRHPQVQITLRDAPSQQLMRELVEGSLDVALISFEPGHLPSALESHLVTHEALVVIVPDGHRLADATEVELGDLGSESMVSFPRGSGVRDTIDDGFRALGLARPIVSAATIDPIAIIELVGGGLGPAIVPQSVAEHAERSDQEVRVVALAPPGLQRTITLAWARQRRALPALDAFLELATDWPQVPE